MKTYLEKEDWRINENANVNYSIGGLILHLAASQTAKYWLHEVYPDYIADAHKKGFIHIHDLGHFGPYCFTGDTKVKLLNGGDVSFKDLVKHYSNKEFYVYSVNSDGKYTIGKAHSPRKTKKNASLIQIELDNGEKIKCTPEHKFLLKNNTYIEAKNLQIGSSLMPVYVYSNGKKYLGFRNKYLHRFVMEQILGRKLNSKEVVHHIDGNKKNNDPSNLKLMNDSEHRKMEITKTMKTDKWKQNNNKRLIEFNKTEKKRKQVSEYALKRQRNEQGQFYNHKVTDIKLLDYTEDVYDITVDTHHNFALSSGIIVHNCAGWSLRDLIADGLSGVADKITSAPANRLSTLCNQMVNFLGIMQNEWAGAQAFSSFDTLLAPFVKKDKMKYKEVYQCIQSFIFGINVPSRWGGQAPFSNITLDWIVPEDLKNQPCIAGGKILDFTYNDCQKEMDMINKALLTLFIKGDAKGRGFQYPIPTYNITKDFKWDTENANLLFNMTAKYGTPYFQNFVNSDLNPEDVRSMCCRLQLDRKELRKRGGGLFGSDDLTGSIGVVTINLPKLGYITKNDITRQFYRNLDKCIDMSIESLEIKRKVCLELLDKGLFPYTKQYLKKKFDNHFSTIGIIGAWEAYVNKYNKTDIEGFKKFSNKVLDHIRNKLQSIQKKTGNFYNLEATPAEGTSYRLAKNDLKQYNDIYTSGLKTRPYYTNSTWLPVDRTNDVFDALDIQDELQVKYTGGTVFHCFLGERVTDVESCKKLVKTIAENYHLPYFSISPTYTICPEHGYLPGEHFECPECKKEIEKLKEKLNEQRTAED